MLHQQRKRLAKGFPHLQSRVAAATAFRMVLRCPANVRACRLRVSASIEGRGARGARLYHDTVGVQHGMSSPLFLSARVHVLDARRSGRQT
jgi:hypothetical protein